MKSCSAVENSLRSLTRSLGGQVGFGGAGDGMNDELEGRWAGKGELVGAFGRRGPLYERQCKAGLPNYASVPRDNFVPVGNLVKHALWAVQTRNGSRGWLRAALRRPLPGPLISGSEAIMPSLFWLVKRFVVLFFKHYIFRL